MLTLFKKITARLAQIDLIWKICNATIVPFSFNLAAARSRPEAEDRAARKAQFFEDAIRGFTPDLIVANGPFKGLQYAQLEAAGSALVPKLLGSYELELQSVFDDVISEDYSHIVDIGCAEGYYAIGIAKALKNVHVYAYDTDPRARTLAQQMAKLNDVEHQVELHSSCSAETLRELDLGHKALIISDCEGYEYELFNDDVIAALSKHDLLIETHDFIDISISATLKKRLLKTHDIVSIYSHDDIYKAHHYEFTELSGYSLSQRHELLAEGRPNAMEWLFCRAKH